MSTTTTDAALLARLHNLEDEEAWQQFAAIYRPRIVAGIRSVRFRGQPLDEATEKGLTDAILLHLREKLPKFRYKPGHRGGFRAWLRTVVQNQVLSFHRPDMALGPEMPQGGTDHRQAMDQMADPYASDMNALSESIVKRLCQDARLRRMALFEEAQERVRQRLRSPRRWEAFWQARAEEQRPTEVAEDLGLSPEAVSMAVKDLTQMLQKELVERLNRLLADAQKGQASEELARYAGRTVQELRAEGVRLLGPLQAEIEQLLEGLLLVAAKGKSVTAVARQLQIPLSICGRAANRLGEVIEAELNDLEAEEARVAEEA